MYDLSRSVKGMVLSRLDASPGVTSLVSPENIFPMQVEATPVYPFIRYEGSIVSSYEQSCGQGVAVEVRLHVFAGSEDDTQVIAAEIVEALSDIEGFQSFDWQATQFIPDMEPSIWHGIVDFSAVHTA